MYAAEVAVDTALGLCVLALFLSLLEKAITMEFMVHSAMGAQGMFFLLGGVTLVGAVFVAMFVKETKGLSDLEKKSLYTPQDLLDEDAANADQNQSVKKELVVETDKKDKDIEIELATPYVNKNNETMANT
jgi:hypothetical protein